MLEDEMDSTAGYNQGSVGVHKTMYNCISKRIFKFADYFYGLKQCIPELS